MSDVEARLAQYGIHTITTNERVAAIKPDLVTRSRWRAERRRRHLSKYVIFPSYRWEVVREGNRWAVVAMQNVAKAT